jgi:hypothetical protein
LLRALAAGLIVRRTLHGRLPARREGDLR